MNVDLTRGVVVAACLAALTGCGMVEFSGTAGGGIETTVRSSAEDNTGPVTIPEGMQLITLPSGASVVLPGTKVEESGGPLGDGSLTLLTAIDGDCAVEAIEVDTAGAEFDVDSIADGVYKRSPGARHFETVDLSWNGVPARESTLTVPGGGARVRVAQRGDLVYGVIAECIHSDRRVDELFESAIATWRSQP